MKKMELLFAFVAAIMIAGVSPANATGVCTACKIKSLGSGPYFDQLCASGACIYIVLDQNPANRPACSSNFSWHFVLDVSTTAGKATYAVLLSAHASGQTITMTGTNVCTFSPAGNVENLSYIVTSP